MRDEKKKLPSPPRLRSFQKTDDVVWLENQKSKAPVKVSRALNLGGAE